jgi:crossover junction endodeoxyribonuclease RuvC
MRVLGIDPGSSVTGYGVVERCGARVVHVAHGTLRLRRGASLADRLLALHEELGRAISTHRPDVAAVERVYAARNAHAALVLGHARGVALAAVARAGIPVHEYAASEIKLAVVGSGAAEKRQVQAMVARLLGLATLPASDAADALAAALCLAHRSPLAALSPAATPRRRVRRAASVGQLVVRRAR